MWVVRRLPQYDCKKANHKDCSQDRLAPKLNCRPQPETKVSSAVGSEFMGFRNGVRAWGV